MTRQITKLTLAQEAILPVIRDEWLQYGLSTQPANRREAEAGIYAAYRAGGLEPPRFILWFGSPWTGAVAQAITPAIISRDRDQVYAQVNDQVDAQVDAQVDDRLSGWYQVRIAGSHWAGYYSWLDAMAQIGVTGLEPIGGQARVAQNVGWWWCYRHFAIVTDRPAVLKRDPLNRLHCTDGPAVRYRDGWAVWAWHGRRVPRWVIEAPTVKRISAEDNVEVRRCAIESLGWEKFTGQLLAEQRPAVAPDPGNPGQDLFLYEVPERLWGSRVKLLLCTNGSAERDGTRRRYGLTVPAGINDPVEAAAWTAGLTKDEYARMVRRT